MERSNRPEVRRDMPLEVPPAVETSARPVYQVNGEADGGTPPIGVRVRWGGVTSGWIMALGTLLLLTTLGLAIGITALGDPRTADSATASGLGMGAGLWGAVTLLIALFLGGLVSTRVTDRPDRGGPSSMARSCGHSPP